MLKPKGTKGGARVPHALIPAFVFLSLALLATGEASVPGFPAGMLYELSGTLFVTGAGFLSATLAAFARVASLRPGASHTERASSRSETSHPNLSYLRLSYLALRAAVTRAVRAIAKINPFEEWLSIGATVALSGFGLYALLKSWRVTEPMTEPVRAWAPVALLVATFPILVLERHLAGLSSVTLPESALLARLCRVPMTTFLGLALAAGVGWSRFPGAAVLIERGVTVVVGLVALELILRSVIRSLTPTSSASERRSYADSAIAGMLRWQKPDLRVLGATLREQLGIDLSQSWALGFIRRGALPAVLCLAVFSWLLTGVSALSLGERALYEVLGQPAGVLHPGLRVHLPWPLGRQRRIDFGTVHEIPVVFGTGAGASEESEAPSQPTLAGIEAEPPSSSDRLWDASHPSEASYLVASNSNGRQNFEVINIDLRVLYRIGMSDEAARQATYNIAAPEEMIRAAAGSMLARYFARYTVLDILGQNREAFIRDFQRELQARLASVSSGVDVLGIIVEAIHPPPAAAPAYQGVQTARIRSIVQIAEAKAKAAETINSAQGRATTRHNEALAAATERVDAAKGELALFEGDRKAYDAGGKAFLFERRLQHLDRALTGVPFTILDHRLGGSNAPLLDLRPASAGRDIPPPSVDPH